MKSVVVTGVSTGIGWGCAKVLAASGYRVFGSVRNQGDADRLAQKLGPNFTALIFDVTDEAAVAAAAEHLDSTLRGETLFGLVNNAGVAVPGPLLYQRIEDFKQQMTVNVIGHLIVTQAFAPLLGADRDRKGPPGRIVMISSVGGRNASPFLGAYNASKFALEGMSESLRRELILFGIDVIVVAPGTVATSIWDKPDAINVADFAHTPYASALAKLKVHMITNGRRGLPPEQVGETVRTVLTAARPKARYTVTPDPIETLVANALPKRVVDRLIAGRLGLQRRQRPA
jgi:NAD(P)-dependent dehydrogenase (short-subunit alcohol dehydrogenase family)